MCRHVYCLNFIDACSSQPILSGRQDNRYIFFIIHGCCNIRYYRGLGSLYIVVARRARLYTRSEYHTQLAKMSFDEIFDLTAGVYFHFL